MLPAPKTLREHAGQCVMIRLGSNLSPRTPARDDLDRVLKQLKQCPVGGLLLFNARWPDVTATLRHAQHASRIPLLVAADVERGVGQQVHEATLFPHAMAVGNTPAPEVRAAQMARMTAREAQACGIHWAFAPVADVNTRSGNPIIDVRAFGTAPDRVSDCVRAYVRTAREQGMLTTAKHFPGHGRTATDSHATRPVVDASRDALDAVDLPPFRAAIDAGVDSVMTAHVAYPGLDVDAASTQRMATASPPILGDLLRGELGFDGLVVSDSLLMEGAHDVHDDGTSAEPTSAGEHAVMLLRAGVDVLLDTKDPVGIVDALVAAVKSGTLSEQRLRDASRRVQETKARIAETWGEAAFEPSVHDREGTEVGRLSHRELANTIATEAVTVLRGDDRLPLDAADGEDTVVIALTPRDRPPDGRRSPLAPFVNTLRAHLPDASVATAYGPDDDRLQEHQGAAVSATHLVIASFVEPAAWQAFGLHETQTDFVRDVTTTRQEAGRDTAHVALGSPHPLDASDADVQICSYSTIPESLRAAALRLIRA